MPHEIFEALDLPFITDVWYSGLVAARRQSAYYSNYLVSQGYHEGLSRYGALGLAVLLDEDNPDKPWGGLSKPALVVTGAGDRAADVLARVSGADPRAARAARRCSRPSPNWWEMSRWQWEDLDGTDRIDVMVEQLRDLISAAESIAGKRMDYDRLREIVDRVNQQEEYFDEVRTIIATARQAAGAARRSDEPDDGHPVAPRHRVGVGSGARVPRRGEGPRRIGS